VKPAFWMVPLACALAGCGGAVQYLSAENPSAMRAAEVQLKLPSEILYVLGGPTSTRHPDIEVFDATKGGSRQRPIYSIPPRGAGEYGGMAVDSSNNLYVLNTFYHGVELDVFPSREKKPTLQCLLQVIPAGLFISKSTLYMATSKFTIDEYTLPLAPGKTCPTPAKTLKDSFAKLRGEYFLAVAQDSQNDVFDTWQSGQGQEYTHIDIFKPGSETAHPYVPLYGSPAFYLAPDPKGNIVTDLVPNYQGHGGTIGVIPYGGKQRRFYDYIDGAYLGIAFGNHDTELFAEKDYPATVVVVYAYDSATHRVGRHLATFSSGIWPDGESIAVYSHN